MSTRSTPVTSYTNGTFSHSLTSTNNTSFGASSSRRVRRADSLSLSSVTELPRRPSILSPRNVPKTAASDTSTPNSRRIKQPQQQQQRHVGEMDWAGMEPDEVFRRLPVNEVRKVESKMREDALNKQSELRSMVGYASLVFMKVRFTDDIPSTRYRDLLTSATQITTLHSSSLHLSSSLRTVAQACSNPSDIPSTSEGDSLDQSEEEDVMSMLPVAAHMKLLLDAPEGELHIFPS